MPNDYNLNLFRAVSLQYFNQIGTSAIELLKELIEFDYKNTKGLIKKDEGSLKQWVPVIKKSNDSARVLVDNKNKIIGYWHFVSLKPKMYRLATLGKLLDSQINIRSIYSLRRSGKYNIYLIEIALQKRFRDTWAIDMLEASFFDAIKEFAEKNIFFENICLNAYTLDGLKRCKRFGMKKVADHISKGGVYALDFMTFLKRNAKNRPDLLKIYRDNNR